MEGSAPFLRKETSEFEGEGIVDSTKDSANLRRLVYWSLGEREDSTFGESQK